MARLRMKVRDVDTAASARFLQAFGWLSFPGMMFGGLIGFVLGGGVASAFLGAFLGIALVGGVGGALVATAVDRVGGMARVLYNPSGDSTPHSRDHSYAKSLAARGAYEEAVAAYRTAIEEDPRDPTPYIQIARMLRDELGRPDEAAAWFRRARAEAELHFGTSVLVTRELVELYRKLGEPTRAAPELARLAEAAPETPEGRWAAEQLAELKRGMAEERE